MGTRPKTLDFNSRYSTVSATLTPHQHQLRFRRAVREKFSKYLGPVFQFLNTKVLNFKHGNEAPSHRLALLIQVLVLFKLADHFRTRTSDIIVLRLQDANPLFAERLGKNDAGDRGPKQ